MTVQQQLVFKVATEAHEFEAIHALNYRTFVEEIRQHPANERRRLVDRFHAQNTYVVCLDGEHLVGMVALRGNRPFSLDDKLPDLDSYLPAGRKVCEIRLLAVESAHRKTGIFAGLMLRLLQLARARRYDMAVISGTTRQLKLYRHLGFQAFGPLVGRPGAEYQPMMLTLERFEDAVREFLSSRSGERERMSLLPGPVRVDEAVQEELAADAVSHRSDAFSALLRAVQEGLQNLTGAANVAVALGSGTLANDIVGAQLSVRRGRGIVLSNGEFGERLVDHASRWGLAFDTYRCAWGEAFDLARLRSHLETRPAWLWFVHCETSTGVLNDLPRIASLCHSAATAVCVDAISSLGTVAVDLRDVVFASGVSGKGLGSYPGLAMVFFREPPSHDAKRLPRYVDLGLYARHGAPFTHSSNLLGALSAALRGITPLRYERLRQDMAFLRQCLRDAGLECVADDAHTAPGVVTVVVPKPVFSTEVATQLAACGYAIAYNSAYLLRRNWIQLALMGKYSRALFPELAALLKSAAHPEPRRALGHIAK